MSLSNIISGVKAKMVAAKPYLIGGVVGAVATVIIEFNAGWVVSNGNHNQALAQARVNAVATVCFQQARAHWTAAGEQLSDLEGWNNTERDELAKRFTPAVEDVSADEITSLCGRMLRRA